jgi:putative lipoprotein
MDALTPPANRRIIRGEVILPEADLPAEALAVVVQVEDVSRADAPSTIIAEHRIGRVHLEGLSTIPFTVEVLTELVDERGTYTLRAHIDVNGSGNIDVGDFISTQSHPVLTRAAGAVVRVPVMKV